METRAQVGLIGISGLSVCLRFLSPSAYRVLTQPNGSGMALSRGYMIMFCAWKGSFGGLCDSSRDPNPTVSSKCTSTARSKLEYSQLYSSVHDDVTGPRNEAYRLPWPLCASILEQPWNQMDDNLPRTLFGSSVVGTVVRFACPDGLTWRALNHDSPQHNNLYPRSRKKDWLLFLQNDKY